MPERLFVSTPDSFAFSEELKALESNKKFQSLGSTRKKVSYGLGNLLLEVVRFFDNNEKTVYYELVKAEEGGIRLNEARFTLEQVKELGGTILKVSLSEEGPVIEKKKEIDKCPYHQTKKN